MPEVATTTTGEPQSVQDPNGSDVGDDRVVLNVGDDFQEAVDVSDEGTTFFIAPGVHRLQEVRPKTGMTFEGASGSIMSGAIELDPDGWVAGADDTWTYSGIEKTGFEHGVCIDGYEGCRLTQDLYVDDVTLWQVTDLGDLGPGRWYWDDQTIHIADDPHRRRVELSLATYAFVGSSDDVTIRGLIVEKYAVPAQFGAVQAADPGNGPSGSNWVIEDSEIRLNHGAGIQTGDATTIRRVFVHQNGQLGIAGPGGTDGLVEDSEIADNNIAGFKWGWEAGGAKFTETTGLVVRRNLVYGNDGPGLWTDINNYDTLYESNTVRDNSGPGIFHEISYDALIVGNTVTGNGFGWDAWLWGSGILVAASSDVEVRENTVTGNADGIGGIQQDREDGPEGPHLLSNMHVHHNTISVVRGHTGIVEDVGDLSVFTDRGNRFESNTYVDTQGRRFLWMDRRLDASGWQDEGQDVDGVWR